MNRRDMIREAGTIATLRAVNATLEAVAVGDTEAVKLRTRLVEAAIEDQVERLALDYHLTQGDQS